jgi:hypothetical protein
MDGSCDCFNSRNWLPLLYVVKNPIDIQPLHSSRGPKTKSSGKQKVL